MQGNEIFYSETKPINIGTEGTSYSVSFITDYTNGLKFGNDEYSIYIMTPEAISLADADDNSQTISTKNGFLANVTLTGRTLYKDGKWNTICLPFTVALEGSPLENAVARPLSEASITGTTLNLTFGEPVATLVAGLLSGETQRAQREQRTQCLATLCSTACSSTRPTAAMTTA